MFRVARLTCCAVPWLGATVAEVYQSAVRSEHDITRRQGKELAAKARRAAPPDDIVTLTRTYDDILMSVSLKSGGIVNPLMLVASRDSIELLRSAYGTALYIDGTHDMAERGCQLITMTITVEGHGLTVAYGITRQRTHDVYVELFRALRSLAGNEQAVKHVVLDSEEALHSSVRATWPSADLHLCFFHYLQAIRKWFLTHRGHDQVLTCIVLSPPILCPFHYLRRARHLIIVVGCTGDDQQRAGIVPASVPGRSCEGI